MPNQKTILNTGKNNRGFLFTADAAHMISLYQRLCRAVHELREFDRPAFDPMLQELQEMLSASIEPEGRANPRKLPSYTSPVNHSYPFGIYEHADGSSICCNRYIPLQNLPRQCPWFSRDVDIDPASPPCAGCDISAGYIMLDNGKSFSWKDEP